MDKEIRNTIIIALCARLSHWVIEREKAINPGIIATQDNLIRRNKKAIAYITAHPITEGDSHATLMPTEDKGGD